MTNFIIGAICGIAALLLLIYIIAKIDERSTKKEISEDYENVIIPKSKMDIKRNITFYMHDDEYTAEHLDDDQNIIAFISCNPKNIENADFYYSLFDNNEIINIIYNDNGEEHKYYTVITQIKLIDENTLRIYYTVLKNYEINKN